MRNFLISVLIVSFLAVPVLAEDMSTAVDPLYLGVGARPLGMGKTYVAVAENADGILLNPAGLGVISQPKLTSMYTNLMSGATYMVIAGGMPVSKSVGIGAGIATISVADIALFDEAGVPQGEASYMNGVVFISAGVDVDNDGMLSQFIPLKGLKLGANVKLFMQNSSGSELVSSINGSGLNMDIGALYDTGSWYKVGINYQNSLPPALGAKLSFTNGVEEEIPSLLKIGSSFSIMGPSKALMPSSMSLSLGADVDITRYGTAGHLGLEFSPITWLSLRGGIDQDGSPTGIATNPTAGVGLLYGGFSFDYAYHPYDDIAENTTHFFSISYVGEEDTKKVETTKKEPKISFSMNILNPDNNSVIYADRIKAEVEVSGQDDSTVKINDVSTRTSDNKLYMAMISLRNPGKNIIVAEAENDGSTLVQINRILKLESFSDVKDGYWAKKPIESCATLGLVNGFPDGTFKPERTLTRAELATLIVRAKGIALPKVTSNVFKDVPKSHWAAPYILAAKKLGLVKGYPDGTFKPSQKINRVEGITVFARMDDLGGRKAVSEAPYKDIPTNHWAAALVSAARDTGLLDYITTDKLLAKKPLSRAEAVEVLSKTQLAKASIEELWNFSVGYDNLEEPYISKAKNEKRETSNLEGVSENM